MSQSFMNAARDFTASFTNLARLPRAFWIVIGAFVVESSAYFGVLTLMASYVSRDLGWGDVRAGFTVSLFTMAVTLFMLGAGSYAEGFGLRRAILFALLICTGGRALYSLAPGWNSAVAGVAVLVSLLLVAVGAGILQPVCYSGVKQYTDEKTSSMGYALIYAIMNLGIVGIGAVSAWIRPAVQDLKTGAGGDVFGRPVIEILSVFSTTGVQAVNWACTAITGATFVLFLMLMTRRIEAAKIRPDPAEAMRMAETRPLGQRLRHYFAEGPFCNTRFLFFIFMLLPVRTLFAHQWLTFPEYILRAYDKGVADHMEWLVNWINPMIIFIGVPVATALSRRADVYTMMVIGSLVSAVPTFLLCAGPNLTLLIAYFVVFSIGEALWSARFLEYASELAPPGRVAQYMGLAQIPWLLAKGTTGLYSGYVLSRHCPEGVPPAEQQTGTMWLLYGSIAMMSPIGLWLARKWVRAGLRTHHTGGV
ncbi:MAG TPA: MFS transporter [Candidatus Paceibacterota bacterium]|nr:MFS transporter [Candidatus Paceibacterota bacterium]HRZ57409.1 MFS transporter [Candidatus Paceibacterota bacterium]